MQTSKVKRYTVITDGEDKEWPPKKKPKTSLLEKLDTETGHVSLDEGPKQMNIHVFSQASEDAQDTCKNTEVCCLDDSEDASARETSTSRKVGCLTDEDKWGYLELDKMATKDPQVRIYVTPK